MYEEETCKLKCMPMPISMPLLYEVNVDKCTVKFVL